MAGLPVGLVVVASSAGRTCFACGDDTAEAGGLPVVLGSNELAEAYLRQVCDSLGKVAMTKWQGRDFIRRF